MPRDAVEDEDRVVLLGGRLARDVDAGADVRVEPLVAEELVLLGRSARLCCAHMDSATTCRVVCAVDDDRLVAVLVSLRARAEVHLGLEVVGPVPPRAGRRRRGCRSPSRRKCCRAGLVLVQVLPADDEVGVRPGRAASGTVPGRRPARGRPAARPRRRSGNVLMPGKAQTGGKPGHGMGRSGSGIGDRAVTGGCKPSGNRDPAHSDRPPIPDPLATRLLLGGRARIDRRRRRQRQAVLRQGVLSAAARRTARSPPRSPSAPRPSRRCTPSSSRGRPHAAHQAVLGLRRRRDAGVGAPPRPPPPPPPPRPPAAATSFGASAATSFRSVSIDVFTSAGTSVLLAIFLRQLRQRAVERRHAGRRPRSRAAAARASPSPCRTASCARLR